MDREKAQKEKDSILNKNQPVVSEGSSEDKPLLPVKSVNWSVCCYHGDSVWCSQLFILFQLLCSQQTQTPNVVTTSS